MQPRDLSDLLRSSHALAIHSSFNILNLYSYIYLFRYRLVEYDIELLIIS